MGTQPGSCVSCIPTWTMYLFAKSVKGPKGNAEGTKRKRTPTCPQGAHSLLRMIDTKLKNANKV